MLASKTQKAQNGDEVKAHLVVTRYDPARVQRGEMLSVYDVQEILAIPLLGVIPESKSVLSASNSGVPVVLDEKSDAGGAYFDTVDRFLGEEREYRFMDAPKSGFFSRIFGK